MGFCFTMPKYLFTGKDALKDAMPRVKACGQKALIVTGPIVAKIGILDKLTEQLTAIGIPYTVFTGITSEPTDSMVEAGYKVYQEESCDFLIGLGGGSPIDAMKAIGILATNEGSIANYELTEAIRPLPPIIVIPTTAGTGSEATKGAVITDTKRDVKMLLSAHALMPYISIVDAAFTLTSPNSVTASTGLDALAHAVEAFTSRKAQPLTDLFALSAIKRIFANLPVCMTQPDALQAREEMSLASLEAGVSINNASVTVVHGMSRPIGALFHVPHGLSNAMLMQVCFTFALDGALERFAAIGREIGAASADAPDMEAAKAFLSALKALLAACAIPTLAGYGVDQETFFAAIPKMAHDAVASGSPGNTRKVITEEDIQAMYRQLW